jgi:hypothetical protein
VREGAGRFQPATLAEWRAWLADHHADRPEGVWLVRWRVGSGGPRLPARPVSLGATRVCPRYPSSLARPVDGSRGPNRAA